MVLKYRQHRPARPSKRLTVIALVFFFLLAVMISRLFFIQVLAHKYYQDLADNQHLRKSDSLALRGEIFAHNHTNGEEDTPYPLAINNTVYEVYLNPSEITRPINTAETLAEILKVDYQTMLARAEKENDIYEPVVPRATEQQIAAIGATQLPGIHWKAQTWRSYPDKEVGSHIVGFYGLDGDSATGRYGLEGYWQSELSGTNDIALVATDPVGGIIPEQDSDVGGAINGSDLFLTIDRVIQYQACKTLERGIEHYAADDGTVIVMEPATGKILALCNYPSFDPNSYNQVPNVEYFNNNAVFEAYEPGSVFKPISMAMAIDTGKVSPSTTYEDKGEVKVADRVIRNFDQKAHGVKTMVEVLQESLNLGIIAATKDVPNGVFYDYVKKFGFGQKAGVELSQEMPGSLGSLDSLQDIYKATAAFGQGISVTPLQMLTAINVIANDGVLVKPYIVEEIRRPSGKNISTPVTKIRQVIKKETAEKIAAMMVSVIDYKQTRKAAVPGYFLAGKTGTAQIAEKGKYVDRTNHTFVGFGPVENPRFSILIKMGNVKNVNFASDSTSSMFAEIAKFLLNYYKIPPSR